MELQNLKFSGHESFHCRPFWLKKGYDHMKSGNSFGDQSGVTIGVGRNMVGSIRFWLKAFDLVDENDNPSDLAERLFNNEGWDPFLEDEATLWLLHYKLSSCQYASTYNLIFSNLRKIKPEFSKNHFVNLVREMDSKQSDNIVEKDFSVFLRTYLVKPTNDKEESFSGLFNELGLVTEVGLDSEKNELYNVSNKLQSSIPWEIVLFCILDNESYGKSISLQSFFSEIDGIGNLLAFSQEGLETKLVEISESFEEIVYKNDAGVKELQFKNDKPDKIKILEHYYDKK